MITVKEAQLLIAEQAKSFGVEIISIKNAQGRVLAEDVFSDRDYPPFFRASMDGYAFRVEDFQKGIRKFRIIEEIHAGAASIKEIKSGECYKIMTGAATPLGADTILRVEDTEQNGEEVLFKTEQIKKGQNIAKKGEDKMQGGLVMKKDTRLSPLEIASLAVMGKSKILVHKLPKVVIISTGNELVPIGQDVLPFQIRESNSYSLEGFFRNYNIEAPMKIIVRDDKQELEKVISENSAADILLLSGGVSMGDADYVPEALAKVGIKKVFHKIAIRPGKPLWFGKSSNGVVFALPGNPVSVQVGFKVFIEPFIRKCFGLPPETCLRLPIATDRIKKVKLDEYFPCTIEGEEQSVLKPVMINGSGDVTSAIGSHGIGLHEMDRKDLTAGETIKFYLW